MHFPTPLRGAAHRAALRLVGLSWLLCAQSPAADTNDLAGLLRSPMLGPEASQAEAQAFTEKRVPRMPAAESASQWEKRAERLREDVLEQVVFRGEAAK